MVEKVTLENAIYVTVAIRYPLIENGCYPATMATVRRGAVESYNTSHLENLLTVNMYPYSMTKKWIIYVR